MLRSRSSAASRHTRRAGLWLGCAAVLLGGAGAALHPAVPHADHGGVAGCGVCLHAAANPVAPAAAVVLPAAGAAVRLAARPAPASPGRTAPPTRGRAPPASVSVS